MQQVYLSVENLAMRVQDFQGELSILEDVSFEIAQGTSVAIVGASGSGKLTLLGLLAGLDVPSAGQVRVASDLVSAMNEDQRAAWRRQHVGFVFQSFQLLPHLTTLENVMLPLELLGVSTARVKAQALLDEVGLHDRLGHYPRTLSGGEQQRVALARAFVTDAPLLFADEPTGSLDAHTGEQIIALMMRLHRSVQSTLILVTHDPSLAARCDRQIHLSAGRVVTAILNSNSR